MCDMSDYISSYTYRNTTNLTISRGLLNKFIRQIKRIVNIYEFLKELVMNLS